MLTESYEDVSCSPADKEENTEDDQIEYKDSEEVCPFYLPIEKKRTSKMTRLNMKTMKKVSFSHADREEENTEENTEDDQIEYKNNEESVLQEMEDDIQALRRVHMKLVVIRF